MISFYFIFAEIYHILSSGGICTAILALKSLWLYRGATEVTRTSSPIFLIDRNAHKSVFDGLTLANTGAIVLPVLIDQNFQVPLGIDILELEAALEESKERVKAIKSPLFFNT